MLKLLNKERKLASAPFTFLFLASGLLAAAPGYPILLAVFFTTLGVFYAYQGARENRDMDFSLLLPVSKADIVRGKFAYTVAYEAVSFAVMTVVTLVRMTWFADAPVYTSNALMGANFTFLGFALVGFGLFNRLFVCGFFRTGYAFAKPFVVYAVAFFFLVAAAETLHHIPGCEPLGALGFSPLGVQLTALLIGAALAVLLTLSALRRSIRSFERVDL